MARRTAGARMARAHARTGNARNSQGFSTKAPTRAETARALRLPRRSFCVVFLKRADGQALGVHGPDGVDRCRRAGERRDARHAVHHRDATHGAVVEERLPAERRVDDELDVVVEDLVADVRPALVDLEDDLGLEPVRAQEVGGAARRNQPEAEALRSRAIGTTPGLS